MVSVPARRNRYDHGMPIYLVQWPDLSVSVIRANDEEHLQELLDHVTEPSLAIWVEYDGPLWFEFPPLPG